MKKSVVFKLFGGYVVVIAIFSVSISLFTYVSIKKSYSSTLRESAHKMSVAAAECVAGMLGPAKRDDLQRAVSKIGKESRIRISVIMPSGVVIADSDQDPSKLENHKNRIEFMQALRGQYGYSTRYSESVNKEMTYTAVPVYINGKVAAVVRASIYSEESDVLIRDLFSRIALISFLLLVISLSIVYTITKRLSAYFKQLKDSAARVAGGDFSARIVLKNRDDLKELADNFNMMAERLGALFEKNNYQNEELSRIITHIKEGFLVINGSDQIIIYNDAFRAISEVKKPDGRRYWEVLRGQNLAEFIKQARVGQKNVSREFELSGKSYLISASRVGEDGDIVMLFFDISELKKLENIKRVFVSNVSHELRTPLTAIKGFAETIEEDLQNPENTKYIGIIKRHTERLIRIAGDLLTLSELEGAGYSLEMSEVNLKELIPSVVRIFERKAKEKNLTLNAVVGAKPVMIKGDPYRIEQLLINIIENALKYTEQGGVKVELSSKDGSAEIIISDTGAGIPREHISRIFERFYVVDKSRSRKMGGTGLGLSIVKHIVHLHNGSIRVESEPDKGSSFIISLPNLLTEN